MRRGPFASHHAASRTRSGHGTARGDACKCWCFSAMRAIAPRKTHRSQRSCSADVVRSFETLVSFWWRWILAVCVVRRRRVGGLDLLLPVTTERRPFESSPETDSAPARKSESGLEGRKSISPGGGKRGRRGQSGTSNSTLQMASSRIVARASKEVSGTSPRVVPETLDRSGSDALGGGEDAGRSSGKTGSWVVASPPHARERGLLMGTSPATPMVNRQLQSAPVLNPVLTMFFQE